MKKKKRRDKVKGLLEMIRDNTDIESLLYLVSLTLTIVVAAQELVGAEGFIYIAIALTAFYLGKHW